MTPTPPRHQFDSFTFLIILSKFFLLHCFFPFFFFVLFCFAFNFLVYVCDSKYLFHIVRNYNKNKVPLLFHATLAIRSLLSSILSIFFGCMFCFSLVYWQFVFSDSEFVPLCVCVCMCLIGVRICVYQFTAHDCYCLKWFQGHRTEAANRGVLCPSGLHLS